MSNLSFTDISYFLSRFDMKRNSPLATQPQRFFKDIKRCVPHTIC
jgi:hypothetical protein